MLPAIRSSVVCCSSSPSPCWLRSRRCGPRIGERQSASINVGRIMTASWIASGLGMPLEPARPCDATSTRLMTVRSEEHTSELQSRQYLVCRLLLEKKTTIQLHYYTDT